MASITVRNLATAPKRSARGAAPARHSASPAMLSESLARLSKEGAGNLGSRRGYSVSPCF